MLVLHNANILPPEMDGSRITAIAIQNGRIVDSGDDASILTRYASGAETQNMQGKTIWPGLVDAHIHLEQYALSLSYVDCETATRQECLNRVALKASHTPPGVWIRGHGWNQNDWPEGFGDTNLLDAVAPNNPVFLTSKSLHSAWVNSPALRLAGISRETPNPERGIIQKTAGGIPTGILFETGMDLCQNVIPQPTPTRVKEALLIAQHNLLSMGITGVHDFDGSRCFSALQMLEQERNLHLRVVKGIQAEDMPQAIDLGLRTGFGGDFLRIGPVKFFADGALGPRTAAMFLPYENEADNRGLLSLSASQFLEYGKQAVANGLSLAIHAIGDWANHEVLDGYQHLRVFEKDNHLPELRHRIEHVQLIDETDQSRFAEYGIIASMQPIHAISDMTMADRYWGNRSRNAYAWQKLLKQHAVMAFGSDAPVESPNPFLGLHAATTRRRQNGFPGVEGWYPEQKISLTQAIKAYTFGPAFSANIEDRSGKLAPGCYADLIVLDVDPYQIPTDELALVAPVATMVNGDWVWTKE